MKKTIIILAAVIALCAGKELFSADIIVAPNPWVPNAGRTATGTLAGGITFTNIPADSELFIYTVSGNLAARAQLSGLSSAIWDGKNDNNNDVASGVYLWVVKSPEATRTGKLIVVR